MKKLITICLLVVSLLVGGMNLDAKTTKKKAKTRTSQSSKYSTFKMENVLQKHKNAELVVFCEPENLLPENGVNVSIDYVAVYTDKNNLILKLNEEEKERILKVSNKFSNSEIQVFFLEEGGMISFNSEMYAVLFQPPHEEECAAFNIDIEKTVEWIRLNGKTD